MKCSISLGSISKLREIPGGVLELGVGGVAGGLAVPFLLPPLIETFKCDKRAKGLGLFELEVDSFVPFLVIVSPVGFEPEPPSPDPTTEIPPNLLSLFILLLLSPALLLVALGVLDIDTDLGNLFSLALLPPCEIEIPAGNLGTLFGAALDAGSL